MIVFPVDILAVYLKLLKGLQANPVPTDEDAWLYDGFTQLGRDPYESDVEFAIPAAAEAVMSDE